ncbi:Hypp33 [Branchiostoma lanceolatum]|uniref:Hypp33 protein n=1 Tax=Branchiostoma lanceolatum TaxID=7740 RepID=A0A8J9YLN8_BRALA|nr:Hypp33 [Branchiostoma lanceolatum]
MEQLGLSELERKKEDKKKQRSLKELGRKVEEEMYKYPSFVVMPNCPRNQAKGRIGCFREDIDSAEHFEEWWQKNMHRAEEFSQDMYELMAIWFVGPRVLKESCLLGHVIDRNHSKLIKLTMDQLSIMTGDVPKQDIAGPAGSGKTWLLLEKAKQVAARMATPEGAHSGYPEVSPCEDKSDGRQHWIRQVFDPPRKDGLQTSVWRKH